MNEMPLALLVTHQTNWNAPLKSMLERRGCAVYSAASTADAALLMHSYTPPHLVFTDMQLSDGSWAGILSLAETSPLPANVVVVSRLTDIDCYVEALERGAFDFVVPPFEYSEIDHIVRSALGNALVRRELYRKSEREESQRLTDAGIIHSVDDDMELARSL